MLCLKQIKSFSYLLTLLLLTNTNSFADTQELEKTLSSSDDAYLMQREMQSRIYISYESLPLSTSSEMGISGINYDIYPFETLPYFYTGIALYGSVVGDEGGFFTLGYTTGITYPLLTATNLESGFFVGGGGGSSKTFPGSGLMLRTHIALEQKYKDVSLQVGVARTDFPASQNRDYTSDYHAFVALGLNSHIWESVKTPNLKSVKFNGNYNQLRLTPTLLYYKIDNKPTKRADVFFGSAAYQANMTLLGLEVEKFITQNTFLSFEAFGAGKNAAGYASFHTGVGYVLPLTDSLSWENKFIVGMAGDGRIDTGGGLILQPMSGLSYAISDDLALKTLVGRTYAPDGLLSATSVEAGISWSGMSATPKKGLYHFHKSDFSQINWTFSSGTKLYMPDASVRKYTGAAFDDQLGLIGIDLSMGINDYIDILGNTYWALVGNIGSYAEGMFGVKLHTKPLTPLGLTPFISTEIGVAGGGQIQIDGFLYEGSVGVALDTDLGFDLELAGGKLKNSGDSFSANVVTLKLNWKQISFFKD